MSSNVKSQSKPSLWSTVLQWGVGLMVLGFAIVNVVQQWQMKTMMDQAQESVGERLPAMSFQSLDGDVWRYPESLTRETVVYVWATWCPTCVSGYMRYQEEAKRGLRTRRDYIFLNSGEHPQQVQRLMDRKGITHMSHLDPQQQFLRTLGMPVLPTVARFDREGQLLSVGMHLPPP
jgi:thiol-disulfide isomerase/thioredoxin